MLVVKIFDTAHLTKSTQFYTLPTTEELIILFSIVVVIMIIYAIIFSLNLKGNQTSEYFVTFYGKFQIKRDLMVDAFVFGTGLAIAGMSKPQKILGFFNIGRNWDPSLICVAIFATGLDIILFNLFILPKQGAPKIALKFDLPTSTIITKELILGSFLFGIGWGLSGVCPGPAFISSLTFNSHALTVAISMIFGFIFYDNFYSSQ